MSRVVVLALMLVALCLSVAKAQEPSLAGRWNWGAGGGVTELLPDGSGRDARGNSVQWTVRDAAAHTYTLRWSHGYTDTITLAANGESLRGVNDRGSQFSAVRPAGEGRPEVVPQPVDLNGSWSKGLMHIWQDGANVLVTATWKRADGKYVALRGEGQLQGRRAELRIRYSPMTHGPVADWQGVLTVSADGNVIEADYIYSAGPQRDHQVYYRDR